MSFSAAVAACLVVGRRLTLRCVCKFSEDTIVSTYSVSCAVNRGRTRKSFNRAFRWEFAVQAGRTPLLDAAEHLDSSWSEAGYKFISYDGKSRSIGLSSFVDNIYACARQADTAVASLESLEELLASRCFLSSGKDSKLVMQTQNAPDAFRERLESLCSRGVAK